MKNYFETEAYTMNVKEFHYSKGTGYSFSFPIKGEAQSKEGNDTPTVWISGVSFTQPILDRRSYLLRGKLQVKPPYKEYPASLQLVVSEAVLLEEGRYVVAKKRGKTTSPGPIQASKQVAGVSQHTQNVSSGSYKDDFPQQSEEIPF